MRKFLFCFPIIIAIIGCQPSTELEIGQGPTPSLTPVMQTVEPPAPRLTLTDQIETTMSTPTQMSLSQPASENPAATGTKNSGEDRQMPVFIEVIQTTVMGENTGQGSAIGVGPTLYFYDSDNKVLSLNQTISVDPETELIIGVVAILQTPSQEYTKREILQFPAMQPTFMEIVLFDSGSETITIAYENQKIELSAGESRTFKQVGSGSNTSTLITIVSNHGHLEAIQPVSFDGSWR